MSAQTHPKRDRRNAPRKTHRLGSVPTRSCWLVASLAASISAVACAAPTDRTVPPANIFDTASVDAHVIENLWWFLFGIMAVIAIGVTAVMVYAVVHFRERPGHERGQLIWGNNRLEIVWTAAPAVLLVVVFFLTLWVLGQIDPPATSASDPTSTRAETVRVQTLGYLWWWDFRYPDLDAAAPNELHLPVNRQVEFQLTSDNVIHSFWLPQFQGKRDLVPGKVNTLSFLPTATGVFAGACAEFCGVQHGWMRIRLYVEPEADFLAWIELQRQDAMPPSSPQAQRGQEVFLANTCQSCHPIRGVGGQPGVGPDLTHVGSRATIGAGVLENTPENMALWIRNPQEVKPGNLMPNSRLSDDDVQALTAYMESLK